MRQTKSIKESRPFLLQHPEWRPDGTTPCVTRAAVMGNCAELLDVTQAPALDSGSGFTTNPKNARDLEKNGFVFPREHFFAQGMRHFATLYLTKMKILQQKNFSKIFFFISCSQIGVRASMPTSPEFFVCTDTCSTLGGCPR
ncbi:MAG TPA: hypothetical protein VI685_28140 [Candidatus Angelobacter sp.]